MKAAARREINAQIVYLMERGIQCVRLSDYHFRVAGLFDFWPSTGKWKALHSTRSGFGKETLAETARAVFGKQALRLEESPPVTLPTPSPPRDVEIMKKRKGPGGVPWKRPQHPAQ